LKKATKETKRATRFGEFNPLRQRFTYFESFIGLSLKKLRKRLKITRVASWYIYIQKSQLGYILVGLGMEIVGLFYDNLVHFMTIWYIL
jgi:hypothetical protein